MVILNVKSSFSNFLGAFIIVFIWRKQIKNKINHKTIKKFLGIKIWVPNLQFLKIKYSEICYMSIATSMNNYSSDN